MQQNYKTVTKIMFVCTGNTCRSAMAEGMMKKMLEDAGRTDVEVYSAGLHASTGQYSPDEAVIVMQRDYDVDILQHQSINVKDAKIEEMDMILCATHAQTTTLEYKYPELDHKIFTIKQFAYGPEVENKDIEDPWGYPIEVYEKCAKEIKKALEKIIEKI